MNSYISIFVSVPWWRHEMGALFALLALCAGNSSVTGEFPAQRPVTRSFDVFFDLRLNKRWSKQWWGWWFETPSRPLWRHSVGNRCYEYHMLFSAMTKSISRRWDYILRNLTVYKALRFDAHVVDVIQMSHCTICSLIHQVWYFALFSI